VYYEGHAKENKLHAVISLSATIERPDTKTAPEALLIAAPSAPEPGDNISAGGLFWTSCGIRSVLARQQVVRTPTRENSRLAQKK
jgi:hypothetical protein